MGKFRELKAEEIECRVSQTSEKGCFLLLYKDARCDQNILDETVGAMNWQRSHTRDNANCIVSIWDEDKKMWVSKEDTGTESNTEAEKGLASDSFKRACFNWGIGRALYTAPRIWVNATDYKPRKNGKGTYDKFKVTKIDYENGVITALEIINADMNDLVVFSYPKGKRSAKQKPKVEAKAEPEVTEDSPITEAELNTLKAVIQKKGRIFTSYKGTPIEELTYKKYRQAMNDLQKLKDAE